MEVIVATVVATIAVIGLAYSFSLGRSFIDRFEVARAALAEAQRRMETLVVAQVDSPDLTVGTHPALPMPFSYEGRAMGSEIWTVTWFDDPGTIGTTQDLKRVTVRIQWPSGSITDSVSVTRLFPRP